MRNFSVLYYLLALCLTPLVNCQLTSGPYDGALIGSKYPFYNLTQKLDYRNDDNSTFNQRYQIVTDWFQPGGPILLHQSAETDITAVEDSGLFDMAKELGGLVASLEHRFFGTSLPKGYDSSVSTLTPLTLENVLEDAVSFVGFIQKSVVGAAKSKVIVEGGMLGTTSILQCQCLALTLHRLIWRQSCPVSRRQASRGLLWDLCVCTFHHVFRTTGKQLSEISVGRSRKFRFCKPVRQH